MKKKTSFFNSKDKTERFGVKNNSGEMSGKDKKRLIRALGDFDTTEPVQKLLMKLKKTERFQNSEQAPDGSAVIVVSETGYRRTHSPMSLKNICSA